MESIKKITAGLENKILKLRKKLNNEERVSKISSIISLSTAPITTLVGGISIGVAAIPVAVVVAVLGTISVISLTTNKISSKRLEKVNQKLNLTSKTLSRVNKKLSESLFDNQISVREYDAIITIFDEYNSEISKI